MYEKYLYILLTLYRGLDYNTIIDLFYLIAIPDRYTGVNQGNIYDAFAEMIMVHMFVWVILLKGMNVNVPTDATVSKCGSRN